MPLLAPSVNKNMWRRRQNGLYSPVVRRNFPIAGLIYYAPFWNSQLSGSPFNAWNVAGGGVYSCAAIGTTWGLQGRTFDGTDDKIVITGVTIPTDKLSLLCWLYLDPADAALNTKQAVVIDSGNFPTDGIGVFWDDRGGGSGTNNLKFRIKDAVSSSSVATANESFATAGWYYISCLYDKDEGGTTEHQIRINADTTVSVDYSQTILTATGSLTLGLQASDGTLDFGGKIGAVWLLNRKITLAEDTHIYLATKGRWK